jgi:hypothetical protein
VAVHRSTARTRRVPGVTAPTTLVLVLGPLLLTALLGGWRWAEGEEGKGATAAQRCATGRGGHVLASQSARDVSPARRRPRLRDPLRAPRSLW